MRTFTVSGYFADDDGGRPRYVETIHAHSPRQAAEIAEDAGVSVVSVFLGNHQDLLEGSFVEEIKERE
jgi:hypothetical protein